MRIQTFSILAGSEACNARCPFCISKMTPPLGVELKEPAVNWRNFTIACKFAKFSGVTTAMLTSKGEPTLFPSQVTRYLEAMKEFGFPFIEIQSNGIMIIEKPEIYNPYLSDWYGLGLTTFAISIVHYTPEKNRPIYLPYKKSYIDLPQLIAHLHKFGFSVRLACVMADGFIDSGDELKRLIQFAKENGVEQLTVRPVNKPEDSRNQEAVEWIGKHYLRPESEQDTINYLEANGTQVMTLVHGARVFDVSGQNVCFTHSLTIDPASDDIRQLIFFPDGHLRYDWQYPGAILL